MSGDTEGAEREGEEREEGWLVRLPLPLLLLLWIVAPVGPTPWFDTAADVVAARRGYTRGVMSTPIELDTPVFTPMLASVSTIPRPILSASKPFSKRRSVLALLLETAAAAAAAVDTMGGTGVVACTGTAAILAMVAAAKVASLGFAIGTSGSGMGLFG
jgi:hypothetical protein